MKFLLYMEHLIVIFHLFHLATGVLQCDSGEGCYFDPPSCSGNAAQCEYAFTYKPYPDAPNAIELQFEMETKIDDMSTGQFLALGLSKDSKMGDDAVLACIWPTGQSNPSVSLAYNPGYSDDLVNNNGNMLTVDASQKTDTSIYCKFRRRIDSSDPQIFPIDKAYTILVARGKPQQSPLALTYHQTQQRILGQIDLRAVSASGNSSISVNASASEWLSAAVLSSLLKAHGIMMIIGWWFFITTGILFARYFKTMWPESQPCKLKIWFHFHRGLNITGLLLIIAAFVCIWVEAHGEWKSSYHLVHARCGLACVAGGLIQPLMALLRCKPNAPRRPIFNWFHRSVGVISWTVASVTIWWATNLNNGINSSTVHGNTPRALMILVWAALAAAIIALEFHVFGTERLGARAQNGRVEDVQMQDMNGTITVISNDRNANKPYKASWAYLRSIILILFVGVAAGVSITLALWIATY